MKKKLSYYCFLVLTIVGLSASKPIVGEYGLLAKPELCDIVICVCNPNGTALSGAAVLVNGVSVGTCTDVIITPVEKGTAVTITAYKDGYQTITTSLTKSQFTDEETQEVILPRWITVIREVTDDPNYKNAALAKAK